MFTSSFWRVKWHHDTWYIYWYIMNYHIIKQETSNHCHAVLQGSDIPPPWATAAHFSAQRLWCASWAPERPPARAVAPWSDLSPWRRGRLRSVESSLLAVFGWFFGALKLEWLWTGLFFLHAQFANKTSGSFGFNIFYPGIQVTNIWPGPFCRSKWLWASTTSSTTVTTPFWWCFSSNLGTLACRMYSFSLKDLPRPCCSICHSLVRGRWVKRSKSWGHRSTVVTGAVGEKPRKNKTGLPTVAKPSFKIIWEFPKSRSMGDGQWSARSQSDWMHHTAQHKILPQQVMGRFSQSWTAIIYTASYIQILSFSILHWTSMSLSGKSHRGIFHDTFQIDKLWWMVQWCSTTGWLTFGVGQLQPRIGMFII